jgi:hypothetical protein
MSALSQSRQMSRDASYQTRVVRVATAFSLFVAFCYSAPRAAAQASADTVVIKAPKSMWGRTVTLRVNHFSASVFVPGGEPVRTAVPLRLKGTVTIGVWPNSQPIDTGMKMSGDNPSANQHWTRTQSLAGSGTVAFTMADATDVTQLGSATMVEWARVDVLASAGPLDVVLDGNVTGSTENDMAVEPDRSYVLEWRRQTNVICRKVFTLPASVHRKFKCNASTHIVTDE